MFKSGFISYGRKESLGYAALLYQSLRIAGYDVWFDKVNIPDGDDYALRINNGIESSDNFLSIMAPRCMTSPYCLVELEYARFLGKRIIPINQLVIFDTEPKPLNDGDIAMLDAFYLQLKIENPNLRTEKDVLARTLELLGRTDWVYARQEFSPEDIQALSEWQAPYENKWKNLEDLSFLKNESIPHFGKFVDPFEDVVSSILKLIEKEQAYVRMHSQLLMTSLLWKKNQKSNSYLLIGNERLKAQEWIQRVFIAPEQPPVQVPDFLSYFICESRKNAENLYTDTYLLYEEKDAALAHQIVRLLHSKGITVFDCFKDLKAGSSIDESRITAIEQADAVLLITEGPLESPDLIKEWMYAHSLQKKCIPITLQSAQLLGAISKLDAINISEWGPKGFTSDSKAYEKLLNTIQDEHEYSQKHKNILTLALRWERQNKSDASLLKGFSLQHALAWEKIAEKKTTQKILPIQAEFINESQRQAGNELYDVFLSYSRRDGDWARKIQKGLQNLGKSVWFDQECITEGIDFQKEIYKGIESSKTFLFLLSESSLSSPYCTDEVKYAENQGKRILTIRIEEFDPVLLPSALASIQWLNAVGVSSEEVLLGSIFRSIQFNENHTDTHTRWQYKALEWERNEKRKDLLARGVGLKSLKEWYKNAIDASLDPLPTLIQKEYLEASTKRAKTVFFYKFGGITIVLLGMIGGYLGYTNFTKRLENSLIEKLKSKEKEILARINQGDESPELAKELYLVQTQKAQLQWYKKDSNVKIGNKSLEDFILDSKFSPCEKYELMLNKGEEYMQKGELEKAKMIFSMAGVDDQNQEVKLYLQEVDQRMSNPEQYQNTKNTPDLTPDSLNISAKEQASTKNSENNTRNEIEESYYNEGKYAEALSKLNSDLKANPTDPSLIALKDEIEGTWSLWKKVFKALEQTKDPKNLDLSKRKLSSVSDSISFITSLESISLSDNLLTGLPTSLIKLPKLSQIRLDQNKFTIFPTVLLKISTLKTINLSFNSIQHIPQTILKMKALEALDLEKNNIRVLPAQLGHMPSLRILNLRNNQIEGLSETFGQLKSLEILDLSGNRLSDLPASFYQLSALKTLDISSTQITKFPDRLLYLPSLQKIYLGDLEFTQTAEQQATIKALFKDKLPDCTVYFSRTKD